MYKKAFYDQYEEFRELHMEISPLLVKIRQLDEMMAKLPREGVTTEVSEMFVIIPDKTTF